jgi:hypothetical protein
MTFKKYIKHAAVNKKYEQEITYRTEGHRKE